MNNTNTNEMTLRFQHGSTQPGRHHEPQSLTARSVSTSLLKCATATVTDTLTVAGAPVVGRTPVVTDSETVQVIDTTGETANSVTTLQAALDALVLAAGSSDIAVVSLTAGQTLSQSTDVNFAEVQRHYRRVVVRGAGRSVSLTDTVASTNVGGPHDNWYIPVMTTALTSGAHEGQLLLNTYSGHYFAIVDNNTTTLTTCSPFPQRGNSPIIISYNNDADNLPFKATDSLIAFLPTSEIELSLQVHFYQMAGATVEFEEIKLVLTSSEDEEENVFVCALISNGLLYFRGCVINTNDMDPNGEVASAGIRAATTIDGCIIEEVGGGAASLFSMIEPHEEQYRVLFMKSYYVSGSLTNAVFESIPYDVMFLGCKLNYITIESTRTKRLIVDSCYAYALSVQCDNLGFYGCEIDTDGGSVTVSDSTTVIFDTVTVLGRLQVIHCGRCYIDVVVTYSVNSSTGQIYIFDCAKVEIQNSSLTVSPTEAYGVVIDRSSVIGRLPSVTGTTTAAVSIRNNSIVACTSTSATGTNTGLGIEVLSGSSLVSIGGAPYGAAFTSVETNNIKVGDNAAVAFTTIATGLAADVSDYTTASPQMARAIFSAS